MEGEKIRGRARKTRHMEKLERKIEEENAKEGDMKKEKRQGEKKEDKR